MTGQLQVVSASAGTGKTYRLAEELAESILSGEVRPEAVVAITYTRKAAAELTRRLRQRLLSSGQPEAAARVRDGYLGTVHSVAQRLASEFAFEAGLSPHPEPAPDGFIHGLFHEVTDDTSSAALDELRPLLDSWSLAPSDGRYASAWDNTLSWRDVVGRLASQARSNRMSALVLNASAQFSRTELAALLDPAKGDGDKHDALIAARLIDAIKWTRAEMEAAEAKGKPNKTAQKRHELVDQLARRVRDGEKVPWVDLVRFTKPPWTTRAAHQALGLLVPEATDHLSHPRLHAELESLVRSLFSIAIQVGCEFEARKALEHVIDFDDMVAIAADLLLKPSVSEQFVGKIDILLVDEFQDTSPVQLQIILGLAAVASRTLWVGDRKQSIYAFAGADPVLMDTATTAGLGGRPPEILGRNFRSRPPLVDFCSAVFTAGLAKQGFPVREVAVAPACPESPALSKVPPITLWRIRGESGRDDHPTLAAGVARGILHLLGSGAIVREANDNPQLVAATRPILRGDITILARTNKECQTLAARLEETGIPTLVARDGLGDTPEAMLARAALALVADPRDRLAAAEISWFTGAGAADPDAWLTARIREVANERRDIGDLVSDPHVVAILAVAERGRDLAPSEVLDAVLSALDAPRIVLGWPDPLQRLANLEALRGVARTYEQEGAVRRVAVTVAGLAMKLADLEAEEAQALPSDPDAVQILTYHKAKGLEWPVVVLTSLNAASRSTPFGVRVMANENFDAERPLEGRSLRWWPWPYGTLKSGLTLADRALRTPIAHELQEAARAESARLLYVGFTRARDRLVLVAQESENGMKTDWLDSLTAEDQPVLDLPWEEEGLAEAEVQTADGPLTWPCDVHAFPGFLPDDARPARPSVRWVAPTPVAGVRVPRGVRPSDHGLGDDVAISVTVAEDISLSRRCLVPIGVDIEDLGNAVHAFLAADAGGLLERRRVVATRLLLAHDLAGRMDAGFLLDCADAFFPWLASRTGGAALLREWPVRRRLPDGRILRGVIDLLVPLRDGWLLLDHKSFPGTRVSRDQKLVGHAAQLAAYRDAIEAATGKPVLEQWIHLPVRGEVVRLGSSSHSVA